MKQRNPMHIVCRTLCLYLIAISVSFAQTEPEPAEAGSPAEQPPSRAALPERSDQEAAGLMARLPTEQQRMLSADEAPFLSLWLPANRNTAKGTVIVVPGDNETADWPRVVGPLRRTLPDSGWQTLSITLPDPLDLLGSQAITPPPAQEPPTDANEPSEEAATQESPPPAAENAGASDDTEEKKDRFAAHSERVFARIQAAIDEASQQQPANVVLVGHGTGAYWAARFASEADAASVKHLALVDGKVAAGFSPSLEELAPALKIPVADIETRTSQEDRAAALKRVQASKRLGHPNYRQIRLDSLSSDRDTAQAQIARRVSGWLSQQ
jgi:hypothetical protein